MLQFVHAGANLQGWQYAKADRNQKAQRPLQGQNHRYEAAQKDYDSSEEGRRNGGPDHRLLLATSSEKLKLVQEMKLKKNPTGEYQEKYRTVNCIVRLRLRLKRLTTQGTSGVQPTLKSGSDSLGLQQNFRILSKCAANPKRPPRALVDLK